MKKHTGIFNPTINTGVFEARGKDDMDTGEFFGYLSASLLWGLAMTAYIAREISFSGYVPDTFTNIVIGLLVPIAGTMIALKSNKPFISFIGYNMVVVPFGIVLAPIVNNYSPDLIQNAFTITIATTFTMGIAGISMPDVFSRIGKALFVSLIGLIVARLIGMFVPSIGAMTIIDWAAAGIFSLYIGYDFHRATLAQKTLDNAIDISLQLYLDVVNLFLSILRILSQRD